MPKVWRLYGLRTKRSKPYGLGLARTTSKRMGKKRKSKYYIGLQYPSGRTMVKTITTTKTPRKLRTVYYGSAHHLRTEASVVHISKKRFKLIKKRR
jgi:hypothetical protein